MLAEEGVLTAEQKWLNEKFRHRVGQAQNPSGGALILDAIIEKNLTVQVGGEKQWL